MQALEGTVIIPRFIIFLKHRANSNFFYLLRKEMDGKQNQRKNMYLKTREEAISLMHCSYIILYINTKLNNHTEKKSSGFVLLTHSTIDLSVDFKKTIEALMKPYRWKSLQSADNLNF